MNRAISLFPQFIIVFSNWSFENNNVPERIARGFALHERKVLYCRNPLSVFKHGKSQVKTIGKNLFFLDTRFFGSRLNGIPVFGRFQQKQIAHSIMETAGQLGFQKPAFLFHDVSSLGGRQLLTSIREHGWQLVHINLDFTDKPLNAEMADIVYSIPEASFQRLAASFGSKVLKLPQLGPVDYEDSEVLTEPITELVKQIPKPWLVYLGAPSSRLNFELVRTVLQRNSNWSFLFCGESLLLDLPNCFPLPWLSVPQMHGLLQRTDVGLLPYNCDDEMQLHCVPLKLFDYFLHGIPVVATPIRYAAELGNLVYTANDVVSIETAIMTALGEGSSNPIRNQRKTVARGHNLYSIVKQMLGSIENAFPVSS